MKVIGDYPGDAEWFPCVTWQLDDGSYLTAIDFEEGTVELRYGTTVYDAANATVMSDREPVRRVASLTRTWTVTAPWEMVKADPLAYCIGALL